MAKDIKELFTTVSGVPMDRLYTPERIDDGNSIGTWRIPANRLTHAESIPTCTAAGLGRCGSSAGFGTAEDTNNRYHYLLKHGQPVFPSHFTCPR